MALSLAIVANCVNMMLEYRNELLRPTGMDVEHILAVRTEPFCEASSRRGFVDAVREQDLAAPSRPARASAAATAYHFISPRRLRKCHDPKGSPAPSWRTILTPIFDVGTQALETLGAELVAGRNFVASDFPTGRGSETPDVNVLLTQSLADKFFPDGDAVGRTLGREEDDALDTVVGIIGTMHNAWPRSTIGET